MNPLRAYAAIALVVGAVFSASAVLLGAARAEDLETSPIGKVVTATGSVTIEHANAVVVQANIPASNGVGQAKTGDLVRIIECRPLSKLKRWRLGEIVRKAALVAVAREPLAPMIALPRPRRTFAPRGAANHPPRGR